ncbi:hypothetical protein TRFO_02717 [Tritrichomonas foetus]|uniref:C2 NT-type domain-containing protein n=1 Tax=Tritrichomonas foetus TaxID=1144522 RepID=A0A1J4L3G3_9EUKA|nr:hypothetical protein TRFO_02717 [Tritrichomonas foetus]|eukprot:OHT16453.1 hypothetical protein TRFO_02717 [Tritrichomonas foetus]
MIKEVIHRFNKPGVSASVTLSQMKLENIPTQATPIYIKVKQYRSSRNTQSVKILDNSASWDESITLNCKVPAKISSKKNKLYLRLSFRLEDVSGRGHTRYGIGEIELMPINDAPSDDDDNMSLPGIHQISIKLQRCTYKTVFSCLMTIKSKNTNSSNNLLSSGPNNTSNPNVNPNLNLNQNSGIQSSSSLSNIHINHNSNNLIRLNSLNNMNISSVGSFNSFSGASSIIQPSLNNEDILNNSSIAFESLTKVKKNEKMCRSQILKTNFDGNDDVSPSNLFFSTGGIKTVSPLIPGRKKSTFSLEEESTSSSEELPFKVTEQELTAMKEQVNDIITQVLYSQNES